MQGPPSHPPFPPISGICRSDSPARAAYAEGAGIFRIVPEGVAVPSTTGALAMLVAWAAANRVPLVPRGAGSGMAGGNIGSGVVVDLGVLDGAPMTVRDGARRAVAGSAVTLRALDEDARRRGLRLPPDPSSARFATLGGMVSTNASGPRSVAAGSVRRWVEAVEMITPDGLPLLLRRGEPPLATPTIERFHREAEPALRAAERTIRDRFPRTLKNSAGYALDQWLDSGDLLDLVVGAEGTLGFITRAEWRLEPVPRESGGVRAALRDVAALGEIVTKLRELSPSALEYLDASFLSFAGVDEGGVAGLLMVEFEGDDQGEVASRTGEAGRILARHSEQICTAADRRSLEALWSIRHAASPMLARLGEGRRSLQVIEDGCVPVDAIPGYIAAVRRAAERQRLQVVIFGHAGQGNLHVNLLPDLAEPDWQERVVAVFEEVTDALLALGGSPSGEHGDGRLRAHLLEKVYGPEIVALFRLVKDAFDPKGIMNPGVKLPDPDQPPFAHLKVGDGAAQLPPRIEGGLRDIERSAGYSLSRLELTAEY
jgi:FAD/FMN-containing dehydrogenase